MTREEAIVVFKAFMDNPLFSDVHKAAFSIAIHDIKQRHDWDINKLMLVPKTEWEQEPTTKNDLGVDCISRIETIDYLCKHCPDDGECFKDCDEIKHLRQMPSVTPQEPRIGKLIGYIDFLRNTAQGKMKSLNLLEKVVKGELEEIRAEEPFINKPCISEGVCKVDVTKVLEHIDEEVRNLFEPDDFDNSGCYNEALTDVLEILNSHARRLTDENNN